MFTSHPHKLRQSRTQVYVLQESLFSVVGADSEVDVVVLVIGVVVLVVVVVVEAELVLLVVTPLVVVVVVASRVEEEYGHLYGHPVKSTVFQSRQP